MVHIDFIIPKDMDNRVIIEHALTETGVSAPYTKYDDADYLLKQCHIIGCRKEGVPFGITVIWKIRLCKIHMEGFCSVYIKHGLGNAIDYMDTQHKIKKRGNLFDGK